jgi:carbamoyltransferase
MYILGVCCYFHDGAAALLCDGQLVAAAEEERFTRKKHDYEFPEHAIDFCLRAGGIEAVELDYVVFFEGPFSNSNGSCSPTCRRFRAPIACSARQWLPD